MDKKSNRTDLLAAGRKRLEQFRQKSNKGKDGKGKHAKSSSSKSTSRADNSEQHDDDESAVLTSTIAPIESSQLPEKASLHPDSDSSASVPLENSEDSTSNEPAEGAICAPLLDEKGNDKALSVGNIDLSIDDSKEIQNTSTSSQEIEKLLVDDDPAEVEQAVDAGTPMLEAANADSDSHPSTTSSDHGACADEDNTAPVPVEVDVLKKEDQVSSDVGTMQEVHDSGSKDGDRSIKLVKQEDSNLSAHLMDEGAVAPSFPLSVSENLTACEQENSTRADEFYTPRVVPDGENYIKEAYVTLASDSDGQSVSLMKLSDVIKGLSEDDFTFLINSRSTASSINLPVQTEHSDVSGMLREHLYTANISKEYFHLQLLEASKHEIDLDHKHKQLVDEISVLTASLADVNERNGGLYTELTKCRSELKATICEKEELQSKCYSADAEVKELSSKVDELKIIIEESSRSFSKLSEELDCCKHQLADSLAENERVVHTFASFTEEKNKEMDLKKQLLDEKLSSELAGCRSSIAALQVEIAALNVSLSFVTDERMKVEEENQFLSAKNEKLSVDLEDCKCLLNALEEESSKLNVNLAELREDRRMIEEMKENLVHENERLSHEVSVYQERLSEEHAQFVQLEDDLKQARLRHEDEGHESASTSLREFVIDTESWKDCCADMERHNIELEVQYEVMKQHVYSMEVKQAELKTLCETLMEKEHSLRTENTQLAEKLTNYRSRIGGLFGQLDEVRRSSQEIPSIVHSDLEELKKDVMENISKVEGAFASSFAMAAQVMEKLDSAMGSPVMPPNPAGSSDGLGGDSQVLVSVNAACQMIEDLKERLQAANLENKTLYGNCEQMSTKCDALIGENRSAVDLLQKIFDDLLNCLNSSLHHSQERGIQSDELRLTDALDAGQFEAIIKQLSSLLNERQQVKELNDNLHPELLNKTNDAEVLERSSFDSDLLLKLVEDVRDVLKLQPAELNSNEPSLVLLQSLLSLLVGKYKDADNLVRLLRDDLSSRMMELSGMQEYVESLNSSNFQQQNEVLVLTESLKQAKDAFDVTRDQLLVKATELEHCEQRFASIREKLSIAVAKGKGLIVQRDSLKQSLSETSIELDRCSQELQLKEARVHEVEHKLKAYSEAGERVEALESELSYIRNSATALRESFLLKDSALQRIEEILEDLELPEHFHSRDIVEKVDYLAKTVAANSLFAADWEQRSTVGGGTSSDTGIIKTDSWKDDAQPSLNLVDDLRRQYDELQNRFYALAEQNEMLEQSLIERNNLVQRWEGVLDRIDTPLQIRSMEPDERIQWLGTALSEADHHMSSLQQKVDNLESYCGSLVADLEEYQRRVSELEFSLQTATHERNDLEQSLIERNNLMQRWEEVLGRIDTPLPVRSLQPEQKIQWLGTALSEADNHMKSLQQKVDSFETYCGSITANLEESQTQISELQFSLQAATHERNDLEQSLIERNNLMQRWEEVLGRIDTPLPVRSLQPEQRIQWLGTALSEADNHMKSLQQKVDSFETYCGSITANLEGSQTQISELQFSLQAVNHEKETLSADLAALRSEHEESSEKAVQFKQAADDLRSEVDALQEKVAMNLETEKHILQVESQMLRWRDLIIATLQSHGAESLIPPDGSSSRECLETLIQRLVDEFMRFRTEIDESRARDTLVEEVQSSIDLRKELDDTMGELAYLKEERDEYMKKSQSLGNDLEELENKKEELQRQLNQEEQKAASLREKLNVAVKKGKSLVQHRDALKQSIEGFTAEISSLKADLKMRDDSVAIFEEKIKDLSSQIEIGHVLESENSSLRNHLMETMQQLQEREQTLNLLLGKLDEINIGSELEVKSPMQKLEEIQKLYSNLHGAVASSEQETKKAKRAAELLLAELNEVQERNDNLQEDLAKAYKEISDLSRQRDVAESAKLQVISCLQELSEETRSQRAVYELLKSHVHKLEGGLSDISSVIADVFAKDMDLLHRLRDNLELCVKAIGSDMQLPRVSGVLLSWNSDKKGYRATYSLQGSDVRDQPVDAGVHLSQLARDTEQLKERIHNDSQSLQDEAELLLKFTGKLHSEAVSLKRSLDSIKTEYLHLESTGKKRDTECTVMHQCISSLYEVCCSSIMEIENRRAQVVGNGFPDEDLESKLKAFPIGDGGRNFSELNLSTSTEDVKRLGDRLLIAVRDFVTMHAKSIESDHKEMRATISNLQKELQEKDIQKERMSMELVSQIKEAEATAKGYSYDLQSAKVQVHDLEKRLQLREEERKSLENRVADMQQKQVASAELQERVASLTGMIAAKEQEIEALMQALDEEENQMEGLKTRVEELEIDVKRKSQDLEQAVTARAKALKKLSITVGKFDELHHMSEGLLSEIENLQTQLQDRESEISFLRQEVTRCTNDALLASKTAKERNANELQDLLAWLETTVSRVIVQELHSSEDNSHQNVEQKDRLQKSIASIITELEELRIAAQRRDALLHAERNKFEDLLRVKEALEASLRQKESHLSSLVSARDSGQSTSEIVEVESVINKWVAPVASTTSQVRSLRKSNNEQVAIAIDADTTDTRRLEDEDDDKVHGFKSLTTSRFVPKFTRPVSDMIDGLWVSCDRALMRQPGLRLGIMIYWAILHALLATFVV